MRTVLHQTWLQGDASTRRKIELSLKDIALGTLWTLPYGLRRRLILLVQPELRGYYQDIRNYNRDEFPGLSVSLKPQDQRKSIFIHIPKCAGTSVGRSLFGAEYSGNHMGITSYQIAYSQQEFEAFFKFTFVRNPWDRVVSGYHYIRQLAPEARNHKTAPAEIADYPDFRSFVKGWLTKANARRWEHFRPQHHFVCEPNGKVVVDFVGRVERMAADYDYVCQKLGVANELRHLNQSSKVHRSFQSYYDAETRDIVAHIYRRDIDIFDYSFEG